jgi:hypothetical protein
MSYLPRCSPSHRRTLEEIRKRDKKERERVMAKERETKQRRVEKRIKNTERETKQKEWRKKTEEEGREKENGMIEKEDDGKD